MREARSQPPANSRITFQVQFLQNSAFFPVFWKSQFSVAATVYYIRGYLYFLFTILPEAGIIASHFTHDAELRGPHYPTTVTISMSQPGIKPRLSRVYDECLTTAPWELVSSNSKDSFKLSGSLFELQKICKLSLIQNGQSPFNRHSW